MSEEERLSYMARSPFYFLARLIGRDRKTQSRPTAEGEAGKASYTDRPDQLLLGPPAAPETPSIVEAEAGDPDRGPTFADVSQVDSQDVQPSTIAVDPDIASVEMPSTSSDTRTKVSRPKRAGKSARVEARPQKQAIVGEPSSETLEAFTAPPTASEELLTLDNEIQELRHQLTAKLQLQNVQLRKMLGRFSR